MDIKDFKEKYDKYVVEKRRQFHMIPELALQEHETSKTVVEELAKIGIESTIVADTGVLATIKGKELGKRVALRADIDALSVTEDTGAEYASTHPGKMHACGHDAHIAMLLGAARILNDVKNEFPGEVRLMFEPAEEVAKGALKMIEAGAMEGVDSVFGMHVWSDLPAGKISCEAGSRMASADFYTIDIEGKSCHGSRPDQGIDAVVVGSALVQNLQTIVSRETDPLEPVVVSVGEFKAGEANNVIAGHAHLSGTTRAFTNELRDALPEMMERICRATGEVFRANITLNYRYGSSPVINSEFGSALAEGAVIKVLGADALCLYERTPGGENFSEYLRLAPGAFAFVGVSNPALDAIHPQHSCHYKMDESALIGGSMVAAQYAIDFLTR